MDQNHQHTAPIEADHAFGQLSGEVSLLRRALEGLSAERQSAPEYGPTLTAMDTRLSKIERWAGKIAETPLLRLTPDTLLQEIARVAVVARQADRDMIERGNSNLAKATAEIQRVTESAWTASDQRRALCITGGISVLLTIGLTLTMVELDDSSSTRPSPQNVARTVAPVAAQQPTAPPRHRHVVTSRLTSLRP